MSKFAIFTISGEEFGLEVEKIFEIIKPTKITPIPNTPSFVIGVINLRGTVIPLIDIRKRLNVEPSSNKEKIIVAKMYGEKIGLLVDSVKEIINIERGEIALPPVIFKGLKPEYLNGIGKIGDSLIIILNLDTLLTSEEIMLLGALSEKSLAGKKEENQIAE